MIVAGITACIHKGEKRERTGRYGLGGCNHRSFIRSSLQSTWLGEYAGIFPCVTAKVSRIIITLKADSTYTKINLPGKKGIV